MSYQQVSPELFLCCQDQQPTDEVYDKQWIQMSAYLIQSNASPLIPPILPQLGTKETQSSLPIQVSQLDISRLNHQRFLQWHP